MFTSAAPLFLSFFTSSAPGYTGSPSPSTTAASFVFTVMPPKGVAIFTLSLPFLLSDSIRQPLASTVAAISVATTKAFLFLILRLPLHKEYAAFDPPVPAYQYPPCFTPNWQATRNHFRGRTHPKDLPLLLVHPARPSRSHFTGRKIANLAVLVAYTYSCRSAGIDRPFSGIGVFLAWHSISQSAKRPRHPGLTSRTSSTSALVKSPDSAMYQPTSCVSGRSNL